MHRLDKSCHTDIGHSHIAEKEHFSRSRGRRSSYSVDEVLKQLDVGRDGATRIMAGSKPFHDKHDKARGIVKAIDGLVETLTGDREKFWTKSHG